jgi:hypothetical protein
MKKRDLFRILIKLFGTFAFLTNVFAIIGQMPYIIAGDMHFFLGGYFFLTIALVLAFLYTVLKPDGIIDFLKLDKGFDEDESTQINIDGEALAKGGLVVMAAYFFLQNFSEFLYAGYSFIKTKVNGGGLDDFLGNTYPHKTLADLVVIGINLGMAWLIITNVTALSRYLSGSEKIQS